MQALIKAEILLTSVLNRIPNNYYRLKILTTTGKRRRNPRDFGYPQIIRRQLQFKHNQGDHRVSNKQPCWANGNEEVRTNTNLKQVTFGGTSKRSLSGISFKLASKV